VLMLPCSCCTAVAGTEVGVRGANGAAVPLQRILNLANASSRGRSNGNQSASISQAEAAVIMKSNERYYFQDGDEGDKGRRRKFIILNDELIFENTFSFTRKWRTIHDSTIDANTRELFRLFGTSDPAEFDFDLARMLNGTYGVAPWSVSPHSKVVTMATNGHKSKHCLYCFRCIATGLFVNIRKTLPVVVYQSVYL
jgi:hypothetical protein